MADVAEYVIYSKGDTEQLTENIAKEEENYSIKEYDMKSNIDSISGLNLKKPIPINIRFEDDYFFIRCSELEIDEGAETQVQAMIEFKDFLFQDFQNWLEIDDSQLTDKALSIKHRYLEYIEIPAE